MGGGGRYNVSKKDFVKGLVEVLYFLLLDWETKLSEYWHFAYTQFNISNLCFAFVISQANSLYRNKTEFLTYCRLACDVIVFQNKKLPNLSIF